MTNHVTVCDQDPQPRLWNSNYVRVWVANFMLFFAFYLLTPLLPIFLWDTFKADSAVTGIVLSGYTVTALITRPFSGYIVDSFPRKKVLMWCFFFFAVFFAGYFLTWSLMLFAIIRTLHGAPFGALTVANSTMAIDVLHPRRRAEGIGFYGLSNNIAMAIGPSIGMFVYREVHDFNVLFGLSLVIALLGLVIDAGIKARDRQPMAASDERKRMSLDRFFLVQGWSEAIVIAGLSFGFGIIATYLAIYSETVIDVKGGTAIYFALLAAGLIGSRLVGSRTLRRGLVVENAQWGMTLSLLGYLAFVVLPYPVGYYGSALVIGMGNGHMFPAMQTMFINLAHNNRRGTANSTLLVSWDVGIGLGIVVGGAVAHYYGYKAAFWNAFAVNLLAVAFFWLYVRGSYLRNRLR